MVKLNDVSLLISTRKTNAKTKARELFRKITF